MKQLWIKGHRGPRRPQAGFTLLEALIALLVMSFGMLAVAGLQTTLSRNSDLAKQRSEAVRLAQLKMEELRSFDGLDPGSGLWTYTTNVVSDLVGDAISAGTNTTFTRTWAVTRNDGVTAATGDDLEKWINVSVRWVDRAGEDQRVTLNSVIARNDPIALKGLVGGQARIKVRYPKSRNLNIPYPAVTLAGGNNSAFIPPPGNVAYVFDNDTGSILKRCVPPAAVTLTALAQAAGSNTVTVTAPGHPFFVGNKVTISGAGIASLNGKFVITSVTAGLTFTYVVPTAPLVALSAVSGTATLVVELIDGLDLATSGLVCTNFSVPAYLLSGFVRFKTSGAAPNAGNIENTTDTPLDLLASGPLTISTSTAYGPSAQVCYAQRQKVLSATNLRSETIANAVRTSDVVTITTSRSHSFSVGLRIAIEGSATSNFNNSFIVASVPSATTLTYSQEGADASSTGGTVSLIQQITIPETEPDPTGYTSVQSKFISYACIVTPVDDDADTTTARAWWGELTLVPNGWTLGSTAATYRVCRFSGDYIVKPGAPSVSNHEHPRYYRRVNDALDNQNFLVVKGNDNCPTDVDADPLNADYINTNTASHQGGTAELSFKCGNAACTGAQKIVTEPAAVTDVISMF